MVPCLKHPATKSCLFRLLFVGTTQVHVWPHQKSRGEVDSRGVAEKERNTGRSERGLLSGSPIPRRLEEEGRGERKQGGGGWIEMMKSPLGCLASKCGGGDGKREGV